MKTARMSAAASYPLGGGSNDEVSSRRERHSLKSAALESAVDAYATRILEERSPPEAQVDSSLGPYVTSVLRSWDAAPFTDISELEEFDSLVELVEEHCSMDREDAVRALKTIADAVWTGFVSEHGADYGRNVLYSGILPIFVADVTSTEVDGSADDFPTFSAGEGPSPMKPDSLIPFDLLGVLDDPPTPSSAELGKESRSELVIHDVKEALEQEEFPPLGESSNSSTSGKKAKGKKTATKEAAPDLAAVLFRPARSTHTHETEEVTSPKLKPVTPTLAPQPVETDGYFQQLWDSAVEMLLSMNHDLSEEAAAEAALVANTDVNIAQYIIDGALAAPAVCRHMLNDGCYRSDCQFSHDIDGHTCLFWLRGRCGKGNSCRFLHGFSAKLMEGIEPPPDFGRHDESTYHDTTSNVNRLPKSSGLKSEPLPIAKSSTSTTTAAATTSGAKFSPSTTATSYDRSGIMARHNTFPGPASGSMLQPTTFSLPSSWETSSSSTLNPAAAERAFEKKETSFSFANIATRGYDQSSFSSPPPPGLGGFAQAVAGSSSSSSSSNLFAAVAAVASPSPAVSSPPTTTTATSSSSALLVKTVKIPQDLWNPHINRDSSAFHIVDPMERYHHVAQSVQRADVIDLHFQSTKTFAAVLEKMLPEKLEKQSQVWVVTGSGHHVGTKTHQKGGGALESAVLTWLNQEGYEFVRGRDRNGHGGALLVKR